jgi:hypothetical protein
VFHSIDAVVEVELKLLIGPEVGRSWQNNVQGILIEVLGHGSIFSIQYAHHTASFRHCDWPRNWQKLIEDQMGSMKVSIIQIRSHSKGSRVIMTKVVLRSLIELMIDIACREGPILHGVMGLLND